jgi:predicted phosphodiesterase
MRYALISDIHGNLPALEAVLAAIDATPNIGATYHLGDLVGYGPWPNETVALLHSRGIEGVNGNYDSTVATDYKHCGCKYVDGRHEELSHRSFAWTKEHTSRETKELLGALPFRLDLKPNGGHTAGPTLALIHGTPTMNTVYWTEDRPDSFCLQMAGLAGLKSGDAIAFGHTHVPWHRQVEEIHFINTGSAGRPMDGDWRAGYVIVSTGEGEVDVSFERIEYDVERTQRGIRESDLPDEFAEVLGQGQNALTSSANSMD